MVVGNTIVTRAGPSLDATGAVLSSDTYDAYGKVQSTTPRTDPFGYGGQYGYYTDQETGLQYLVNRYYDAGTGRFLTRDPSGYGGGINLYAYCGNNPANSADSLGLSDGYWDQVGQVFVGYYDTGKAALNPIAIAQGVSGVASLAYRCGVGTAATAVASGLYHGFTDWTTTSDPKKFGESFGNVLIAAATLGAPKATCLGAFGKCFVAGTLVQMANGTSKPIEDVKPGDLVLSRDIKTAKDTAKRVIETRLKQADKILTLTFVGPVTGDVKDVITCTPEHPFYVVGKGFVDAGKLGVDDAVVSLGGPALLISHITYRKMEGSVSVYNLTIEDDHTYFVGKIGELVHNYDVGEVYDFADAAKKMDHAARHGDDFGDNSGDPDFYEKQGSHFVEDQDPNTLVKTRPNGDEVRYNPVTEEFAVSRPGQGILRTYYKPDPAEHGYPTNLEYFNAQ